MFTVEEFSRGACDEELGISGSRKARLAGWGDRRFVYRRVRTETVTMGAMIVAIEKSGDDVERRGLT
jgi:hypothetical protein